MYTYIVLYHAYRYIVESLSLNISHHGLVDCIAIIMEFLAAEILVVDTELMVLE